VSNEDFENVLGLIQKQDPENLEIGEKAKP
jgi:hypothetical protein